MKSSYYDNETNTRIHEMVLLRAHNALHTNGLALIAM